MIFFFNLWIYKLFLDWLLLTFHMKMW